MSILSFFRPHHQVSRASRARQFRSRQQQLTTKRRLLLETLEVRRVLTGSDNFATAFTIPGNVATYTDTVDNSSFSQEANEPNIATVIGDGGINATKSAWWKVQVPSAGTVTIDTQGTNYPGSAGATFFGAYGDTVLGVYTGASVGALTAITSNDDADGVCCFNGGGFSKVTFAAAAGTSYYVQLNGYDTVGSGDFGPSILNYKYTPDVVYVDDSFVGYANGDTVTDADLGTTGNQAGIFNVTAFTTITAALAAVNTNGTIVVNGGNYGESIALNNTRTLRVGGPDTPQAVAINALASINGTTINLAGTSTLSVGDATSTTIAGVINGGGNFTKTGAGTITLENQNTYAGATTIAGGILRAGTPHQAYQITGNSNSNQVYGGSLGYDFTVAAGRSITVTQLGFYDANPAGLNTSHSVNLSSQGGATVFATATIPAGTAAPLVGGYRFVTLATPITLGPGNYTVWGDNYGVDNNYNSGGGGPAGPTDSGATGEISFIGNSRFGSANAYPGSGDGGPAYRYGAASFNFNAQVLPAGTAVNITSAGAALDLNNTAQTIGSLAGVYSSSVTLGSGSLTIGGSASTTFAGVISGTGSINKTGTGILTLSGANTYSGATNVLGGTLKAGIPTSTTNLLAYYDFNDPNNLGRDGSINANNGTLQGGAVASSAGAVGGALSLPAGANGYLQMPNLASLFAGQAATLSVWTKLNVATPGNSTLTGFANLGSGSNDHYPWVDGTSYQNVFRNNSRVDSIALLPGVDRTQWHLVTIVSDPTDAVNGWRMYQNGTLIRSTSPVFGISGFQIGVQNGFFLNGFVDDVRLYNRALSTAEVQALSSTNVIPDSSPVMVVHGATFEIGNTETIGSLSGLGTVALNANTLIAGGNNTSTTYGGAIGGTGGVTKEGTGTFTLSGTNTYTGATNINAGTLNLGGSPTLPSIPGLYEWFDGADSGSIAVSGNQVVQWLDKSGGGHHLNQGTAANQPTLVTNAINGNSVVRFDGNDVISNVAANNTPNTPYTVLSAARLEGTQNQRLITSNNNWLLGYWGGGMDQFYADGAVRLAGGNPVPDTAVHFYGAQGTGSVSTFFDANRLIAQNNGGLTSPNGISLGAFAGNPASEASRGDVAELLVFKGILNAAQLADVYAYLQSKWSTGGTVLNDVSAVNVAAGANLNVNVTEVVGNVAGAGTTTLNKDLTINESGTTTYSGVLQGPAGFIKAGTGTLTLSGNNSYSGASAVIAGTLVAASNTALGLTAGGTVVFAGATLALTNNIAIGNEFISAAGTGVGGLGAIRNLSGNNSLGGAISLIPTGSTGAPAGIALQNGTASFSQSGFSPAQMIDGLVATNAGGWANAGNAGGSNAVFETVANLNPSGAFNELTFSIFSGGYGNHTIGRFKLYVTTDDRATFANAAINGGQIGYNWTELLPTSATSVNGNTLTINADRSILASGTNPDSDTFTIKALTNLANITGIRIETIKDPSLPSSGPGRASNGNYVIVEWTVSSAIADATNLTITSDAGALSLGSSVINTVANGTVTFAGSGNINLTGTGVLQTSGTTNVIKTGPGTLTNSATINSFAGTLAINGGTYIAASNSALGTTAGGTSVAHEAVLAFSGGITIGNEALTVTAVNGNAQDALVNLSGANTFGGSITVVPFTFPVGTTTGVITGGDVGEGLDLSGNFVYAINAGGPAVGPVQGANFTSTEGAGTPGVTYSSPNVIANYTSPNYGATTNDDNLEVVMRSIRWNGGPVSFDFANLVVGRTYKLQLMFSDAYNPANRRFNITTEGATLATNFTSGSTVSNPVFTQIYQATDTVLNLLLSPGSFGDTNPIISGITIEDLGAPVTHDLNIRSDAGSLALNGPLGLNSSILTVKGGGTVLLAGNISESGASQLVKTGTGVLYVDGANSYTGLTTINGGYLVARNNLALGTTASGTVVNSGGTLQLEFLTGNVAIAGEPLTINGLGVGGTRGALANWTGNNSFSGPITIASNSTIYVQSGNLDLSGVIQGAAGLTNTKIGGGDLTYSGSASNTFAGTTILDLGNLYLGKTGGAVAMAGPMQMGGGNANQPNLRMLAANQFAAGVVMSGVAAQTLHARFDLQGFDQTLAGLVSPNSFLVVQNERLGGGGTTQAATLTLNGSGNYTFAGGFLRDEDDGGTTFKLNLLKSGTGTQTLSGNNVNYTGTTTVNGGLLRLVDTRNFRSALIVNAPGVLEINSSIPFATRWNYGQAISGNGTINKTGSGVFGITGANSFAGLLQIQQGTIHNDNLTANWSGSTADVNIASGAFLDLRGNHITIDSLTGPGSVINSYGNGTNLLTIGAANGSGAFDGTISGSGSGAGGEGNGRTALTKVGAGVLTLSNASTYFGPTSVTGGTLGGDGSITSPLSVSSGATLSPGLTIGDFASGDVTLASGAILAVQLNNTTPGTGYDQLVVNGTVTINGATLTATHGSAAALGDVFRIIDNDGSDPTVGQFSNGTTDANYPASTDQIITISGARYYLTYNDPLARFGTGNDVALIRNREATAVNDTFGPMVQNGLLTGNVKTNDIDPDRDGLVSVFVQAAHGTATILDPLTGTFTYQPDIDFIGADTFTYQLLDGETPTFATVTITVSNIVLSGGTLYVSGSSNPDRIILSPGTGGGILVRYNNLQTGPYLAPNNIVVYGNGGDDTITSSLTRNVILYGDEGNDYLTSSSGNDTLDGGAGNDRLLPGAGNDVLLGGDDNDTLTAGAGNDLLYGDAYLDRSGALFLEGLAPGRDTLSGEAGNDRMYGGSQVDTLNGGLGNDFLRGGEGDDTLTGEDGNDVLVGDDGSDKLYGRAGRDVLIGGTGFDTLLGGTGSDLMYGSDQIDDSDALINAIANAWFTPATQANAITALTANAKDDSQGDSLNGEGDADWYLLYLLDSITLAAEKNNPNKVINLP